MVLHPEGLQDFVFKGLSTNHTIRFSFRKNEEGCFMKSLITIAVSLAFAAVASGNLPKILFEVRKAQIALIKESQASKWPKAMTTLPSR